MTKIFRNDRLCLLRIDLIEKIKKNKKQQILQSSHQNIRLYFRP